MKFRVRRLAGAVLLALGMLLAAGTASPALSAPLDDPTGNDKPIDWTIDTPFVGRLGDQIPLRVGQNDDNNGAGVVNGFGVRHIIDAHGAVPPPQTIDNVLQTGNCTGVAPRFSCETQEAVVAFSTAVDPRSGDNLPFGIITAFFKAPDPGCGC